MKRHFIAFFLVFSFLFSLSTVAGAQVTNSIGGLELTPSTSSPVPGQTVTIVARSYTIDIDSAKVTWYMNGKILKSGTGLTSIEIPAPALGKKVSIEVTASNSDGIVVRSSVTIGSGSVDLIFETDGYVPPFFKGKTGLVYQNSLTIIAVPHLANSAGVEYDPATLVYQWKKGDQSLEGQSGYGKRSIKLAGEIVPRPFDISVTVWTKDNNSSASAYASVEASGPEILFYVDDPQYGTLYNRAIGSSLRIGKNKETSVLGVPFGFNKPRVGTGDLDWSWGLNNASRASVTNKESVTLRAPDESAGSSNISVNIRNTDKILQGASAAFSAIFGASNQQTQASF